MSRHDRLQVTHAGSLPRPDDLVDLIWAKVEGRQVDESRLQKRLDGAVREVVERQHVSLQERFLGLGAEASMERPTRVGQPHHEHPALDPLPANQGIELAEVDLASAPAGWVCGMHTSMSITPSSTRRRAT